MTMVTRDVDPPIKPTHSSSRTTERDDSAPVGTMPATHSEYLPAIVAAVETVGIPVQWGPVTDGLLLPGIWIENAGLTIDTDRLLFAGDVLHEAGHLAVMAPGDRAAARGTLPEDGGQEIAALTWSYAMALEFDLPLDVVFHDAFKANGPWLRKTFSEGCILGQPLLQYWQMTRMAGAEPHFDGLPAFPKMGKWLRDR